MGMQEILSQFRQDAFERGEFRLLASEIIDEVVVREGVSSECGVYVIYGCRDTKQVTLYIGKSGVKGEGGKVVGQGLRQHFCARQGGIARREYFQQLTVKMNLDALHIEWFVTSRDGQGMPPWDAEEILLSAFADTSGMPPALNRCSA